ncbi:50S ribosomal protein L14-like [Capsicum annuum]|uniref:50S ribosomal protein L14-like n=1 Tax=Capsicum annuum TaxID=4072 RepID=UPI001FB097A6|nr:50S ribosomal protein L14-like [Capsicum annuum]
MIQPQTHLNVADNSGAQELMCIRIIGASHHRYAHIGDVIVAVIKEAVPNMPLERSEVVRAIIVQLKMEPKNSNSPTVENNVMNFLLASLETLSRSMARMKANVEKLDSDVASTSERLETIPFSIRQLLFIIHSTNTLVVNRRVETTRIEQLAMATVVDT